MKIQKYIIITLVVLSLITACGTPNGAAPGTKLPIMPDATAIQNPEAGKAIVTGKVSSTAVEILPSTAVWLAEVVRQGDQGVYVLDSASSPGIYTDENSVFVIANINPGEYVIVVGDPEGQYEIVTDSSGIAKVWNIPPDQIYDVGDLKVALTK